MCGGRANRGQEKISTSQILIFLHQTMEALIIIDIKLTQVYKGINLSKYSFTKYKQKLLNKNLIVCPNLRIKS